MTTIKEIAQIANVSTATVSNVINNTGRVGSNTRKRILDIIEENHFSPNLVARGFRQKTSMTLGVIVEGVTRYNIGLIMDGICEYAEECGYSILLDILRFNSITPTNGATDAHIRSVEKVSNFLLNKQVDALIYIGTYIVDLTGLIKINAMPIVYAYSFLDESKAGENEYCISYDEKKAAYDATQLLIDAGHKNIGCITGDIESISAQERLLGFQECLRTNKLVFFPEFVKQGDWFYQSGYEKAKLIFSSSIKPTAIFIMGDFMAYGLFDASREAGISIPEQLSVVSFGDLEYSNYSTPKLTSVKIPLKEIGRKAAETAINALGGTAVSGVKVWKLPCEIKHRDTVRNIE